LKDEFVSVLIKGIARIFLIITVEEREMPVAGKHGSTLSERKGRRQLHRNRRSK